MRYKYTRHLNDLNDLRHIEWFVEHSGEYEFQSPETQAILNRLRSNLRKKNIFYSDIVRDYNALTERFENDPYNYQYEIHPAEAKKEIRSRVYTNYFVKTNGQDDRWHQVPYAYITENPTGHDMKKTAEAFGKNMAQYKQKALDSMNAVMNHYMKYWNNGGMKDAMGRYKEVQYGKKYHLIRQMIFYLIYNWLLFLILHETQFFGILTHFWQIWSDSSGDVYSLANVFVGHKYLGIFALVCTAYFVVMDVYYTYGIYYTVYVRNKYNAVKKYHDEVLKLFTVFYQDMEQCRNGITEKILQQAKHRDSVYIPLIHKVNRRYRFTVERKVKTGKKGKKEKRTAVQPVLVPHRCFYSQSLASRVIMILILLIFVQSISSYRYIIFY